ncbi:glutathione gamma-glutamylcysteinyltransferase 1-like isoform X2 [Curcuma longa]|uniref:glutathione gamma-glutamylcysteinyltransferase 1-like isoform X2 n=1 Tax=Curcuma longa TaxID=136217 RepID=UPI003D9F76A4
MAVASFYRRVLPSPPAIEFPSPEGKRLFCEALQDGTMEGFFKLISHFQTQSEPAFCGLASLSMVLNALAIDPRRKWKGPWRWYDETMLDCCEPLEKVKAEGITFGKVACLAQCAGAKVEAFRTNQCNIDDFRHNVIKCSSSEDCHLIASYSRKPLKQTGIGHFSPIGGYHAESDMVLILDVARFKYPPHWVPLALLWEAMDTIDNATGHRRGFMLISGYVKAPSLLYTLNCRDETWLSIAKYLINDVPILLKSEDLKSASQVLYRVLKSLPACAGDFIKQFLEVRSRDEDGSTLSNEEKERLALKGEILKQVHETVLFRYVTDILSSSITNGNLKEDIATVCCQGAGLLPGVSVCRTGIGFKGGNEQGINILVPASASVAESTCSSTFDAPVMVHSASNDAITVLLLALPASTWSGVKDANLLVEIQGLFSTENLANPLQNEVLHLRQQFYFLRRCADEETSDDLKFPVYP